MLNRVLKLLRVTFIGMVTLMAVVALVGVIVVGDGQGQVYASSQAQFQNTRQWMLKSTSFGNIFVTFVIQIKIMIHILH